MRKYWTEKEIELLEDEYKKDKVDIISLARKVGRLKSNVCRKAREIGLPTNYHRPKNREIYRRFPEKYDFIKLNYGITPNETIAKLTGYSVSGIEKIAMAYGLKKKYMMWDKSPHPRGFLGSKHTLETRRKLSDKSRNMWADPNSKVNTEEFRNSLSDRGMRTWKYSMKNNHNMYSRCKRGRRVDLNNRFFRSSWEANYARYLNYLMKLNKIQKWDYECKTFDFLLIKRGCRQYTPDFEVVLDNGETEYHEVKGWMDNKSKTKLSRMALYYPNIKIVLVDVKEYSGIAKYCKYVIPNWE